MRESLFPGRFTFLFPLFQTTSEVLRYEKFNPANYPNATSELSALKTGIPKPSIYFKVEIIVSHLKNHSLQIAWVDANPALTRKITTGFFKISQLESIFESGRNNQIFLKDFEEYMGKQLLKGKN